MLILICHAYRSGRFQEIVLLTSSIYKRSFFFFIPESYHVSQDTRAPHECRRSPTPMLSIANTPQLFNSCLNKFACHFCGATHRTYMFTKIRDVHLPASGTSRGHVNLRYNTIGLPVAAGVLFPVLKVTLPPALAGGAMVRDKTRITM